MGIPERKERERLQRQKDIIDAAEYLFARKGFAETTMDDIATEAELSKGTLYLYFKSKEELQWEVSLRGANLLKHIMDKTIDHSLNALENLRRVGWAFIGFSREHTNYFNLFILFQSKDLQMMNIEKNRIENYFREQSPFATLINLVKQGVDEGSLRKGLGIVETASALWSQMLGILIVQQNKKDLYQIFNVTEESVLETNFSLLMYGIANK